MNPTRTAAALAAIVSGAMLALAGPATAAPVINEFAIPQTNSQPLGLAPGGDGALWFTQANANRIGRITTSGTFSSYAIPSAGASPQGIVAGPDGRLWFAEHNVDRIGAISTAGVITEYAAPSSSGPVDVAAGPDGALWFTEGSAGKVGRITTSGSVTEYSTGSTSSGPQGITAGPDGNLWFAESGSNKIGRMTTAGTVTEFAVPTSNAQPLDIIEGPDGALWFTEMAGNKIGRITTTGQITEYPVPTATSKPLALAEGPDGAVWFTESNTGKIGRITTAGAVTEYAVPTASPTLEDIVLGSDGRMWFAELASNKVGALAIPPGAGTGSADGIDPAGATLRAAIDPNGQTVSYRFDYGTTALYGQSTGTQSASGAGTQAVSLPVTGLAASTTYHFRVVATSAGGTAVGADSTFTTPAAPVVDTGSATTTTTPTTDQPKTDQPTTDQPETPPSDPALAAALVVPSKVTVSAAGQVPLTVACPAQAMQGCHGSITLTLASATRKGSHSKAELIASRCARGCRPLGGGRYAVRRGGRGRARAKLNAAGRKMLAQRHTLRVLVTMRTTAGGETSTKHRTIVLERRVSRPRNRKSGS